MEADEESVTNGPGIRYNGDDDDMNGFVDLTEFGVQAIEENDLIEVRIDRLPGQGDLVLDFEASKIAFYESYDKLLEGAFIDGPGNRGNRTEPLTFDANNSLTIWVEWFSNTGTTAFMDLVDPMTNMVIDTLNFHLFTSKTIVLGGFRQAPTVPTAPSHGIFKLADGLYSAGYDVQKFDEDRVAFVPGFTGSGDPYDDIENAVNNMRQQDIAIMGYSQGGGSAYFLWDEMVERRGAGDIGAYNLSFTAYIDAVIDRGFVAEDRLPTTGNVTPGQNPQDTQYHVNIFQQGTMFDGFFLDGTSIPNSNDNINVEDGGLIDLPNATHGDIDDAIEVLDFIQLRYFQNLDR